MKTYLTAAEFARFNELNDQRRALMIDFDAGATYRIEKIRAIGNSAEYRSLHAKIYARRDAFFAANPDAGKVVAGWGDRAMTQRIHPHTDSLMGHA